MRDRDITVNTVSIDIERPPADGRAADVVAYLLSDEGHALTGQIIHLDDPTDNSQAVRKYGEEPA
jgi:enoyl-[acyl-carrier-protein] reductase (NADH)